MTDPKDQRSEFERESDSAQPGFFAEFIEFLGENKKWWLLPILVVMVALGALVLLSGSPMAPFVYALW
jgi:hypothetical protein